ncbi:MAG: class I SAM-dependent methyltransferase [Candidatus Thermoplasmatota archaeon]|nr:class I SAM-dependent methyltransferase [Candidatus Thermoplasmatota archaeon]
MDEVREKLLCMSEAAAEAGAPLAWFEELYSTADRDDEWIPWSDGRPNPLVVEWAVEQRDPGRALVVGCGLGEDAAFLDQWGWEVTAFDISPTAVEWAKELFGDSKVEWLKADLLELPDEWGASFDLVLEVHILQAIPESVRLQASLALAPLVRKGGHLVCIGRYQTDDEVVEGPPWPLSRSFIKSIGENLKLQGLDVRSLPDDEPDVSRFRAVWRA